TGLAHVAPRVTPVLDPAFRPAILVNQQFRKAVADSGSPQPLIIALEQADGSVFHFKTAIFPESHPQAFENILHVERLVKFLLWARGGWHIHIAGSGSIASQLEAHFKATPTGQFDSTLIGEKVYDRPITVVSCTPDALPPEKGSTQPLGRHLDGCRIGFDLGGSDRKVAAVVDGNVVFSEEIVWDPYHQPDPDYHFNGIMESLKKAAAHLPRVDAIGGSAAGVYVNNRVKVASLFRGVPADVFNRRVKDLFLEVQRAWNGIPVEVVNDGEVTALAGSMSLKANGVLGIAMGTSLAAGYVTQDGNITTWLNELAFAPVDYNPLAPTDEWSGDYGCGVQYFSQQAVGRLIAPAGIDVDTTLPLPEKLKHVQALMEKNDPRARKIYETIGTYLGYTVAHYADFYDFNHLLILGRVTSGKGGDLIIEGAKQVLAAEFPKIASKVAFHIPDEKDKRHGQAVAAASLPSLK
ncbi:MAG TPA: ROK family protein, partial [Roseimicrobium sp.]|nr:ROK family protein [Roseimicrobium sp.]